MKVFISWSGERSRQVAELFKIWLKCVIQASDPWVSSQDIQNGSWWFNEIGDQLAGTNIGVICLTKENKNKPWILFETGALTKGLSTSRVCPFLIDLGSQDITPPLSQLNLTTNDKDGVFSLVRTINFSSSDGQLSSEVLTKVFNTNWPEFDEKFKKIIAETPDGPDSEIRDDKDILREVLSTVRAFDNRIRRIETERSLSNYSNELIHDLDNYINAYYDNVMKYLSEKSDSKKVPTTGEIIDALGITPTLSKEIVIETAKKARSHYLKMNF